MLLPFPRYSLALLALMIGGCNSSSIPGNISHGGGDGGTPPADTKICEDYSGPALDSLHYYSGGIHAHTAYSDGDIHSIPADSYDAAIGNGLDYFANTEHSDTYNPNIFVSTGSDCFTTIDGLLTCLMPADQKLEKWSATLAQSQAVTNDGFAAIRGFEWTSDRFGHINVLYSSGITNAKIDGGYVLMSTFYDWLQRDPMTPILGGGSDAIAIFNHPNDKKLSDSDPGRNWDLLSYVPAVDSQMVGMELYNSGTSGTDPNSGYHEYYVDWYMTALDQGWHVGAIGGEDMHDTTWADPSHPKTVVLAQQRTLAGIKDALSARRMYALESNEPGAQLEIEMSALGQPMGSRLACDAGKTVPLKVRVKLRGGAPFSGIIRLYDHADPDQPIASTTGSPLLSVAGDSLDYDLPVATGEHWFFVRVDNADGKSLAYTSPIWLKPRS